MIITGIDLIYLFLPMIVGYGTTAMCKIGQNAGKVVKFRPPSFVFGIVWPILFLLLGISWIIAVRNTEFVKTTILVYLLTTLSLGLWTYVYGCLKMKKEASWVILLSIMASIASFSQGNDISKLLISPLIAWLIFALLLNTTEVQLQ